MANTAISKKGKARKSFGFARAQSTWRIISLSSDANTATGWGKKRDKKFVVPRQIAIYIARELTEMAYTDIGNAFGGKDHSTIMSAYNKIAEQIKIDPSLESKIQLYIREIKKYKK